MRLREHLIGFAAVLAFALGLAAEEEPAPACFAGKVKSVEADGSAFVLTAKGGPFHVPLGKAPLVWVHKMVRLADAPSGKGAILGRYQSPQRDPQGGGTVPAQIISVVTLVLGEFVPPPIPKDLDEKKISWHSGKISIAPTAVTLDSVNVQIGLDRRVVVIEPGTASAVAKGKLVAVRAPPPDHASKEKELNPLWVDVLAADTPPAELRAILGL